MLSPFYNEAQVPVGEIVLRLVVNMRTIDATEAICGSPMPGVIGKLLSKNPPMALSGKVLWGLLRQHHPEVTLDEALGLALGEHQEVIGMAMGDLIRRTFHLGEDAKKDENPPKRRGASKPSSKSGSRQKQEA